MQERAKDLGVDLTEVDLIRDCGVEQVLGRLEAVTAAGGHLADAAAPLSVGYESIRVALRQWDETLGR